MGTLESFLAYAADFEKTLADDDWNRIAPHWHDDAVYRIDSEAFGCEITGSEAIFRGMKKSLDGFDRKFDSRTIDVLEGPVIEGDELRASWAVTYVKAGVPNFVLPGKSTIRFRDGKVSFLSDAFEDDVTETLADWTRETGIELDPSYV